MRLTTGLALLVGLLAGVLAEQHLGEAQARLDRRAAALEVQQCTKGNRQ